MNHLLECTLSQFCHIFSGQSPAEADLNLLETARRCELYGTKMHPAKVRPTFRLVFPTSFEIINPTQLLILSGVECGFSNEE